MQRIRMRILCSKTFFLIVLLVMELNILVTSASASTEISTKYQIGSGENSYQWEDLLTLYKSSSTTYARNTLDYKIELYNSDLAYESYHIIDMQYDDMAKKVAQLQELKDTYVEYRKTTSDDDVLAEIDSQIAAIDSQIAQYNDAMYSYKASASEAKLKEEISRFYKSNGNMIQKEAQNRLINDFKKKCFNLILLQEQNEYYAAYQEYLNLVDKVNNLKYQKKLIGQPEIELAKLNLSENSMSIEKYKSSYQTTYSNIKTETKMKDNSNVVLDLSINRKEYDQKATIEQFLNSNVSLSQLQYLKKCYQVYQYSLYGTNTLYQQVKLKVDNYQLQYDEQKANIQEFVSNAIFAYNNSYNALDLAKQQLQLTEKNYNIVVVKKEHKRSTELEVKKAKYEVEAAQVSYYQSIYDIIIWQDILDNSVYGATP